MRMTVMPLAVVAAFAAAGATASLAAPGTVAGKPTVAITGATVKDGVVTVSVRVAGWKLLPALVGKSPNTRGGGHWHVFVDGKYNGAAAAERGVTTRLAPGSHTISVELANNDHSRLSRPVRSAALKVTVAAARAPGAAPPAPAGKGQGAGAARRGPVGY